MPHIPRQDISSAGRPLTSQPCCVHLFLYDSFVVVAPSQFLSDQHPSSTTYDRWSPLSLPLHPSQSLRLVRTVQSQTVGHIFAVKRLLERSRRSLESSQGLEQLDQGAFAISLIFASGHLRFLGRPICFCSEQLDSISSNLHLEHPLALSCRPSSTPLERDQLFEAGQRCRLLLYSSQALYLETVFFDESVKAM